MLMMLYGKMIEGMAGKPEAEYFQKEVNRTYAWLKSNQNSDGGFPAFDKDKNDEQYPAIKWIFKFTRIDRSAEIFDPSCPDIVGHMLEGMGEAQVKDTEVIVSSIEYLINTRKDGRCSARWGNNYVYAGGAVLPGLSRVGYSMNQTWLINVIKRLQEVQQADGGFGEDSDSYNQDKYVEGVTTVSMTAWGLLAYLEMADVAIPNVLILLIQLQQDILRATRYILANFKENQNKFYDRSVVGTGHRGVLNLQYPVYAYSFPTAALARLAKLIKGTSTNRVDDSLTQQVNERISKLLVGGTS